MKRKAIEGAAAPTSSTSRVHHQKKKKTCSNSVTSPTTWQLAVSSPARRSVLSLDY
jgi:hypothetical protein